MIEAIAKDMAATVKSAVSKAASELRSEFSGKIGDIIKRLDSLPIPENGKDGRDGIDGKDGYSPTNDDIKALIDEALSAIELPKGEKGETGERGIDGKDGRDGIDGLNGKDGISPTADEVAKAMEGYFAKWALDFERKADGVLSKAVDKLRQPEDGKPGRDAIELKDFEISLADDGRTVNMVLKRGEDLIERSVKIPSILDRGVFRDGQEYEKGDGVTYGGCFWIAQKDMPEGKPGANEDWRMAVKRGRDGRESVKIERSGSVKV